MKDNRDKVRFSVTIETDELTTLKILRFLSCLYWYTQWGHSATLAMDIDGDGADRVKIEGFDLDQFRGYADYLSKRVGRTTSVEYVNANAVQETRNDKDV